ncbi:MAG: hypothetical protein ACYTA3_14610 [Planctomycetota bacterium]|jgi:hypothetical protein
MTGTSLTLLLHALATMAMTGPIWFVQVVRYPLRNLRHDQSIRPTFGRCFG